MSIRGLLRRFLGREPQDSHYKAEESPRLYEASAANSRWPAGGAAEPSSRPDPQRYEIDVLLGPCTIEEAERVALEIAEQYEPQVGAVVRLGAYDESTESLRTEVDAALADLDALAEGASG